MYYFVHVQFCILISMYTFYFPRFYRGPIKYYCYYYYYNFNKRKGIGVLIYNLTIKLVLIKLSPTGNREAENRMMLAIL